MLFRNLGPLQVEVDELEVPLPGRRLGSVLALLVDAVGEVVSVDALIEATWADNPPARAAQALETVVWRLRSVLEPGRSSRTAAILVRADSAGYRLNVPADSVDSRRFADRATRAAEALAAGEADDALALSAGALALWRGEPYELVPDADWMVTVREQLVNRRLDLAECHVQALLDTGQPERAVQELGPLLAENPFRERFWAQRILGLYRSGRQADALAAYAEARRILDEELGVEPGPELRGLHEQVLNQSALLDRQTHRQLDLTSVPVHLPRHRVDPVGRWREVGMVGDWLKKARLVTLIGPGGVGKTRLAVEVAYQHRSGYPDGVWFVDLTEVRTADGTPGRIADEVAGALGLSARPGLSSAELLRERLARSRLLLVVDNCEHIVDAVATVVDDLIDQCPFVAVLGTSREPLEVEGERTFDVAPLADEDAVSLFVQRLSNLRPDLDPDGDDYASITAICAAVGGLPLGIELAAARARVFELSEVAASLTEGPGGLANRGRGPARHASMLDTVDWSYRLASSDEQALHRRLAIIPGPVTLQAAVVLCTVPPLRSDQAAELLAGLVHRSLLTSSRPTRPYGVTLFRQLVPTRVHAQRQLDESERAAVVRVRDEWVHNSVRTAALEGQRGQAQASAWLDDNMAAVRATLTSMLVTDPDPAVFDIIVLMFLYWFEHGRMREAMRWCETALAGARSGRFTGFDATVATALEGCTRAMTQDRETGLRILTDALPALSAPPDDRIWLAGALLIRVAVVGWVNLDATVGATAAAAATSIGLRLNDPHIIVRGRALRAMLMLHGGDVERARAAATEVLDETGDNEFAVFVATFTNALAALDAGDAAGALQWMRRLARAHRTLEMYPTSELLEDVARVLDASGSSGEAVRCYAAAAALNARDGLPWPRFPHSQPIVDRLRRDLPGTEFERLWSAGQRIGRTGDPVTLLDEWLDSDPLVGRGPAGR